MPDDTNALSARTVTATSSFDRHRRLRGSATMRDLLRENTVTMNDLIYPIFVEEEIDDFLPIDSMPGIKRIPEKHLASEMKAMEQEGIRAVMMFGVSHKKDATGSDSWAEDGLLARTICTAKDAAPSIAVISDTCFCEYTDHGHCGVLDGDHVHNDVTIENLGRQSVIAAKAGVDMVAPSAMMDGQIAAMRQALDAAGFNQLPIMAYSSKFASSFYGPFRDAAGCDLDGDRKTYQMDPLNGREALRESFSDEAEGADILMVKPGMPYLDVVARLRDRTDMPIAAYQVSGEYSMIKFAAQAGALDEAQVVRESLGAFKRAGASLILSYFTRDIAREGL